MTSSLAVVVPVIETSQDGRSAVAAVCGGVGMAVYVSERRRGECLVRYKLHPLLLAVISCCCNIVTHPLLICLLPL